MHLSLIVILATGTALASAQLSLNTTTYQFICPSIPANGAYCTGPSLSTNIIVRCTGTSGVAGNCNDNLAPVPPVGLKGFAPCYQTSLTAGDAACSYNGTVYPDNGPSFPIPVSSSNATTTANTTGSLAPTTTATAVSSNNNSISLPLNALSTSASTPAAPTAYADLAAYTSARYPIPVASNGSVVAASGTGTGTGTGTAPVKTGSSDPPFVGAANVIKADLDALLASVSSAGAVALGLMLLL